jgi:hypothetical protein
VAGPPAPRFKVNITTDRLDDLRRLNRVAIAAGYHTPYLRWVREVNFRLAHEADEWGESREAIPGGRIENRVGVVGELTVWYSIDFGRAVVYVNEFRLRGDPGVGEQGGA